ncbi:TIGR02452 family protein [Bacillus toyonensis]|uniref:TIGR02452 family protein n=1 Tax=Bacillus toyonensis TaxID=155322 RepID=UPI002E249B6E|nr:TIGR02452 family protein [Bacillus toyonensis]
MREKYKAIAENTLNVIEKGSYQLQCKEVRIKEKVEKSRLDTKLYTPVELEGLYLNLKTKGQEITRIEVTDETTLKACERLKKEGNAVMALNFASAKNPGGGFLKGSSAQEESIARVSSLYDSLIGRNEFYDYHHKQKSALYSDHMIYSPNVVVFKDDRGEFIEPYEISFITSAAVNAGVVKQREPKAVQMKIDAVMKKRIEKILTVALVNGCESIVLGAFGCGVFKNNPYSVAKLFNEVLATPKFANKFKKVVFAVYDSSSTKMVYSAFKNNIRLSR